MRIDPATAAAGEPLPAGEWELRAVVHVAGFSHARALRRNGAPVVITAGESGLARRGPRPRRRFARRLSLLSG